jgi:hypothetical protein
MNIYEEENMINNDNELKHIHISDIEELSKQMCEHAMYKYADQLPPIIVNNDEKDNYYRPRFQMYCEIILDLTELSGRQLSDLYKEFVELYGLEKNANEVQAIYLVKFFDDALTIILQARKQSTILLDSLMNPNKVVINGEEYCFIAIFLNNLFQYYSFVLQIIMLKEYLTVEALDKYSERFAFMLSPKFQSIRLAFRVMECSEKIEQVLKQETVH